MVPIDIFLITYSLKSICLVIDEFQRLNSVVEATD